MKYAIIITGQLRTWKFLKPIIENLKKYNDIDFYLSINLSNMNTNMNTNSNKNNNETTFNELNEALKFFKPVSYYYNNKYNENYNIQIKDFSYKYQEKVKINNDELLETSFDSGNILKFKSLYKEYSKELSIRVFNKHLTKKLFEQYFYIYKGYELLETYIKNNKVKYDSIIKLRFDQLIWNDNFYFDCNNVLPTDENKEQLVSILKNTQLKLDIPESNEICILGGGVFENYGYVNDQFWCHNTDLIHIMRDFYLNLSFIIQDSLNTFWPCHGAWIEHFLAKYLFKNNLIIKKSILNGLLIRET
tara:strand:+ start:456 stop:1367 length:912 start_codon:yes stop_codon:yes gene_type:complete